MPLYAVRLSKKKHYAERFSRKSIQKGYTERLDQMATQRLHSAQRIYKEYTERLHTKMVENTYIQRLYTTFAHNSVRTCLNTSLYRLSGWTHTKRRTNKNPAYKVCHGCTPIDKFMLQSLAPATKPPNGKLPAWLYVSEVIVSKSTLGFCVSH